MLRNVGFYQLAIFYTMVAELFASVFTYIKLS